MEQPWDSLSAGHSAPPFWGGTVIVRVRLCVPSVQPPTGSVAHSLQSLHSLTWQSSGHCCSLQGRDSIRGSGQAAPSQEGGVVTVYVRDWVPPPHTSVQVLHSLQVPAQSTGWLVLTHPVVASQLSRVHPSPSSQSSGLPDTQPVEASQASMPLQTSPSLQSSSGPTALQAPSWHSDVGVQASSSLHSSPSAVGDWIHSACNGSHHVFMQTVSRVVSQSTMVAGSRTQLLSKQTRVPLQAFPSSNSAQSGSSKQLQSALGVPRHCPITHWSPSVQGLPSSQGPPTAVNWQPISGWHESSVHSLPSKQVWFSDPVQRPP